MISLRIASDTARSQEPNPSGLGLAVVKSIMALHGGTVSVQSELGKGSTFSLTFPLGGRLPLPTDNRNVICASA